MKQPSLKISVLIALVLLQFAVYAQVVSDEASTGGSAVAMDTIPAAAPTPDAPTPTTPEPKTEAPATTTTTQAPATTTTVAPTIVAPPATTTQAQPTTNPVVLPTTTVTSTTTEPPAVAPGNSQTSHIQTTPTGSSGNTDSPSSPNQPISGTPSSDPSAQTSSKPKNDEEKEPTNKTAIIAGSVVGGVVGIALIAGLLTCLNRRGGCTSRTRRRDVQQDFEAHDSDYGIKMTENHTMATPTAMHTTENQAPSSPFQHARRFVPPTSNPTGYMNLTDEEYGYHQQNTNGAAYQPQNYQDYNNASTTTGSEYDYQTHTHQADYSQQGEYNQHEYRNEYPVQQEYAAPHHEYQHEGSVSGSATAGGVGYQQGYYNQTPGANVTSPTVPVVMDTYQTTFKPDQIEQKPNAL